MSMKISDAVRVSDAGIVRAGTTERSWGSEKSVVEVKGWVKLVLRERGKKITEREGHNVWTNTGREFLTQRISLDLASPSSTIRTDAVAFIGVGIGAKTEEPGVLSLQTPIAYDTSLFLAEITGVSFPAYPVRTTVEYQRTFAETEITIIPGTVLVSELGLFTNGDPAGTPANGFGTRLRGTTDMGAVAPVAYKSFEPVAKTENMQLEIFWQIRF
jgi:hypothetical protein